MDASTASAGAASTAVLEAILPSFVQYQKAVEDTKASQLALITRLQALLSGKSPLQRYVINMLLFFHSVL
jgi:hypothetical protein